MDNQNQNASQNDPQRQNPQQGGQRPEQGAGGDKNWNQPGSNQPGQGGQKPGGQQGGGQQGGGQQGKR